MAQISSRYISGMREFCAFHDLLYACLQDSLSEATFSTSGAYSWRGYRVDEYKTLARGQYYFLTYPGDPKHLLLEEAYWDSKKKYCRPFALRLNLQESCFFLLDQAEQQAFLSEFVAQATRQALIWQASEGRTELTLKIAPDRINGHAVAQSARRKAAEVHGKVTDDYLEAMSLQNQLFNRLTDAIGAVAARMPGPLSNGVHLEPNAHPRNWAYRGYRMKPLAADGSVPPGHHPYRWNIYYADPARIWLGSYDGTPARQIRSLALEQEGFFDLDESAQQAMLEDFVLEGLGQT